MPKTERKRPKMSCIDPRELKVRYLIKCLISNSLIGKRLQILGFKAQAGGFQSFSEYRQQVFL
jgi:hypothetical protein